MGVYRCQWVNLENDKYVQYHDCEWGIPVYDDRILFEFLVLESAQAGLSWETILNKRDNYRKAFDNFDVKAVASYDDYKIQTLLCDKGIVRNRLKINSAVVNAKVFIALQKEYGSFSNFIWQYVNHKPIQNRVADPSSLLANTELSNQISKDLKKRGMKFVGSTIIYSYMQGIGMVNDHEQRCFRYNEVKAM